MNKEKIFNLIETYINKLLKVSSPEKPYWNQEMLRQGKKPYWNYIDGCMMTAFLNLYESSGDSRYLEFTDSFIDYFIRNDGSILSFERDEYNLDNIKEGSVLFKLYDATGKEKYRKAMDTLYRQIKEQPRTIEGNFWHKLIYPGQVWLDGLYMAQPFYVEYEKRYNGKQGYVDSMKQFANAESFLKDSKTGLYYHAYDSPRCMYWSDPTSGTSPHFWGRALGWYVMALVDILDILDSKEDKDFFDLMKRLLNELVDSLLNVQSDSGMWLQVVDKEDEPRNYPETSATAIISYAILKSTYLGLIPKEKASAGERAFWGICERYLEESSDGDLNLGGTCLVAGLGGTQKRDGSFDYYMSEPVVENEAKGIAPFLLAYVYLKRILN